MKLYTFGAAANAQRVGMFMAEKGLDVPTVEPNVRDGLSTKSPIVP